jgi:hypothetical protein
VRAVSHPERTLGGRRARGPARSSPRFFPSASCVRHGVRIRSEPGIHTDIHNCGRSGRCRVSRQDGRGWGRSIGDGNSGAVSVGRRGPSFLRTGADVTPRPRGPQGVIHNHRTGRPGPAPGLSTAVASRRRACATLARGHARPACCCPVPERPRRPPAPSSSLHAPAPVAVPSRIHKRICSRGTSRAACPHHHLQGGPSREAHVPAQQPPPCQEARLPRPHGDPRRPRHHQQPPSQPPRQALRLRS